MKLETDLEVTIESGKEFQILTIQLVKMFLSHSETTVNLANLNELPRMEVQNERATIIQKGPFRLRATLLSRASLRVVCMLIFA